MERQQGLPGWKILVVLVMLGTVSISIAGGPDFPNADKRLRWQDLRVSLAAAKLIGTSDPTFSSVRGKAYAYAFSASQENELFCTVQLPHGFVGSTIDPHLHWMPTNTSVATVVWGMEYVITNYLATVTASSIIATFAVQTPGVDRKHMISEFPHINTAGLKDSCIMQVRIFRNATNASDTYAQPAFATDFDIHYQSRPVDFGSLGEYGNNAP